MKVLQLAQPAAQCLLIGGAYPFAPRVMPPVPLGEVGKFADEDGKEAVPRRGAEPERRPDHVAGARLLRLCHELRETGAIVGDAGDDGRDEEPRVHAAVGEAPERLEPHRRHRRAQLEPPREPRVGGGEGDVDGDFVPLAELLEHVEVACDEGRLGDDAEREAAVVEQQLEDLAREAELSLGGLIAVGGGTDDE